MEEQMVQQEDGWPLGLQPLNRRRHIRSHGVSSSLSFSTIITASSRSSSVASSDLETESSASTFSHDRGITLGRLIGITRILNLSSRSFRRSRIQDPSKCNKTNKSKNWFSLCTKPCHVSEGDCSAPSLGHYLEEERRASNDNGGLEASNDSPVLDSDEDDSLSLVGNGRKSDGDLSNGRGFIFQFTCIGGPCKR